jgi:hypothetical protein
MYETSDSHEVIIQLLIDRGGTPAKKAIVDKRYYTQRLSACVRQ